MAAARLPVFTPAALTFLRALKRNNDREWFRERKDEYVRLVRQPMESLIERLDHEFRHFAPEIAAAPAVSLFRIYRDTRFSEDKSPLKTQVGAVFPHRDLGRKAGACFYVEIGPAGTLIAGGIHAPSPQELKTIRQHIAANHARLRTIVEAPSFRRATGGLRGDQLVRVPRGVNADHPAADYLRFKQWLGWVDHPAGFASSPEFFGTVARTFRALAPLVRYLNEPLLGASIPPSRRA